MSPDLKHARATEDLLPWEGPEEIAVLGGDLQDFCLNSLVQLAQAESISGWIRVHDRGEVSLLKGRITSTVCGELVGFEALRELMFMREGRYCVIRGEPRETNLLVGVVHAIMDAYRLREEWTRVSGLVLRPVGGERWHPINHPLDRLARELDGRRYLAEVASSLRVDITVVLDALLHALEIGLIEPVPRLAESEPAAAEPATSADAAVEAGPEDFDELMERGRAHARAGDLDAAENEFLRALTVSPDDRVAQQNLRAVARRREALRRA